MKKAKPRPQEQPHPEMPSAERAIPHRCSRAQWGRSSGRSRGWMGGGGLGGGGGGIQWEHGGAPSGAALLLETLPEMPT